MSLNTDALLERIRLKSQLLKWRALFVILLAALFFSYSDSGLSVFPGPNYIARIEITGLVDQDRYRDSVLKSLSEDEDVKAVIVHINTPGGTVVGGESIYNALKDISKVKPTVSVMGTLATSAGYMVALGTERIYANQGTLTGSIGVILHSAEIVDLAKKFGIEIDIVKSGPLKASPSPLEKFTPEARQVMQDVIDDYYDVFVNMVVEGRKIDKAEVIKLADGRVYTGNQALSKKLVDEIGSEKEALLWLKDKKGIDTENVVDVSLFKETGKFESIFSSLSGQNAIFSKMLSLQGLLSVWVDGIM